MDDDAFLAYVGGRLGELPPVQAVTLGGSRAEGTHRPDSDWDFSVYYRGHFDPQALRDTGWPGEVFEVGGWSKGVFNGGAWLEIDGRRSDVHYRDLDVVAVSQAAHAILAARGEWVTGEKQLLTRAGLHQVDDIIAAARPDPAALREAVDASRAVCLAALTRAR